MDFDVKNVLEGGKSGGRERIWEVVEIQERGRNGLN